MPSDSARTYLDELDETYARLHTRKEDAFWSAKMGLSEDASHAQSELDAADITLQRFLSDPDRLSQTREVLTREDDEELRLRAQGWLSTFESHVIASSEARALQEELTLAEGRLLTARGAMSLGFQDPAAGFVSASSVRLSNMLLTDPDEARRLAAFKGLRSIESHVLQHGFLDIVKMRNRLARALGAEDYYDWKTRRVEGMSKAEVFAALDELEVLTRDAAQRAIGQVRAQHGAERISPWSLNYLIAGDVTRELDPFFPFDAAIDRWGRSFVGLGIGYGGAELVLDLLDRKGKYENGFMHGPVVAWRRHGQRIRARVQFTANAMPGVVGSGRRALQTLFHEGGHAAHFANIDMPSPCFGQEFAPTSVAFAETQSMFCDSLLDDADWQQRYALDAAGTAPPMGLVDRAIDASQPFAAWQARAMLAICYGEKAIYELPERELTAENVLSVLRAEERRLLLLEEGSPRPTLAVPHLLSSESSAYYHGYVLARMAVFQARRHFEDRDGYLVDNPRIGPELARVWWQPGNSVRFAEFVRRLTGKPLSAAPLSEHLNATAEMRKQASRAAIARLNDVARPSEPVALDARLRVVHGNELIAELDGDFAAFSRRFAAWIQAHSAAS